MVNKILQSRFFTGLIVVVLIFLGLKLLNLQEPLHDLGKESANISEKINEAKQKNISLTQSQQYLTSQSYLERQARLQLNYKNPDEEAVQIYHAAVASSSARSEGTSIFDKIGEWFRHL